MFSAFWKRVVVKVIPKIANHTEFKVVRGISILPFLSQLLEKIFEIHLRIYLYPPIQSGFRKGHSCTTALLDVVDNIMNGHNQRNYAVSDLIDFTRASDTTDHNLLNSILIHMGVSHAVDEYRNHLLNRE